MRPSHPNLAGVLDICSDSCEDSFFECMEAICNSLHTPKIPAHDPPLLIIRNVHDHIFTLIDKADVIEGAVQKKALDIVSCKVRITAWPRYDTTGDRNLLVAANGTFASESGRRQKYCDFWRSARGYR